MEENKTISDFRDWLRKEMSKIVKMSKDIKTADKLLRRFDLLFNINKFLDNYDENIIVLSVESRNKGKKAINYDNSKDEEVTSLINEIMGWIYHNNINDNQDFDKMWDICKFLENHDENIKILDKYNKEKKINGNPYGDSENR